VTTFSRIQRIRRDFNSATIKALRSQGIEVIGRVAAPDFEGDVYFSGLAYQLDDNGTSGPAM